MAIKKSVLALAIISSSSLLNGCWVGIDITTSNSSSSATTSQASDVSSSAYSESSSFGYSSSNDATTSSEPTTASSTPGTPQSSATSVTTSSNGNNSSSNGVIPASSSADTSSFANSIASSTFSSQTSSFSSQASSTVGGGIDFGDKPVLNPGTGQAVSGDVIYTPVPDGESPYDYPAPVVLSGDGNTYSLPYPHIFDYGSATQVVLDDFNDNDHQNNLASAFATYGGYNSTEGGGFWYVFKNRESSIKNATNTLDITGYNISEAIDNNQLCLKMQTSAGDSGYVGVGTNILFEENGVDLSDLVSVEITASGSGTIGVMFDSTAIDRTAAQGWGNFATVGKELTLSSSPATRTFTISDFKGELYSSIENLPLSGNYLRNVSKFFLQAKNGRNVDICIQKVVLNFDGSKGNPRLAAFSWKADQPYPKPGFVFDPSTRGVPAPLDETDPYLDWSQVQPLPAVGAQEVAPTKTAAELAVTGRGNWLTRDGTKLRDTHGHLVRLTGVNWFGFETKNLIPFGLWQHSYKDVLAKIKATGFNTVRIPFTDAIIDDARSASPQIRLGDLDIDLVKNGVNATDTPLILMDKIIDEARALNLKVILDSHSRKPDMYLSEGHWAAEGYYSEAQWIDNWKFLTQRYLTNDAVIAMDLKNEPHFEATWGGRVAANDWKAAAERAGNAILAINPNVLIIVEGVERLDEDNNLAVNSYWWGGNMQGVREKPIQLLDNNKLIYSPHEYGPEVHLQPWFRDYRFPTNLPYIWEDRFGFIYSEQLGHLFIGEFGVRDNTPGSAHIKWFDDFVEYMCDRSEGYSWTVWAWNPNSSDTGGIMQVDWTNVNQWKLDKINHCLAPVIGNRNGK